MYDISHGFGSRYFLQLPQMAVAISSFITRSHCRHSKYFRKTISLQFLLASKGNKEIKCKW